MTTNDFTILPPGPLDLSDEDVAEFQRILKEETGQECSAAEARLRANELIQLVGVLAQKPKEPEVAPRSHPSPHDDDVLHALTNLGQAIAVIRPNTKDWAWPVTAALHLTRVVLERAIATWRQSNAANLRAVPPDKSDATELLRLARGEGIPIDPAADRVLDRLSRLQKDLSWIPIETWDVLGDQLPGLLQRSLIVVGALVWTPSRLPLLSEDGRTKAERMAATIEQRLLQLETERRGKG